MVFLGPGWKFARRLLVIQVASVTFLSLATTLIIDGDWGMASIIGGGIFIISNVVFVVCAFFLDGANFARYVTISFYAGELLKFITTVTLFSVVYVYVQVKLLPLNLSYILLSGINIFAPAFFIEHRK
ncbi:ATP synthase protein I [Candidatus Photodesmus blepharus]|uniref:ATP synthase protein I n=1 Tax=Candidatus Photodesmus blepharonis TaxID=1179155 RepID=A0A084CNP1_9GAMM|nr:ATP synthase subunit I [Candidatus Photodesmus blepharus]KEY91420.1 ATP synthase protein I [Candidatus Photodesmus blepharus]